MHESDILFENTYTDTLETLNEMNWDLYAKSRKIFTWSFGTFAAISLLLCLVTDIKYLFHCLFFLAFLFYSRNIYRRAAKQQMKTIQDFYDGVMPTQVIRVTADTLYYINGCQSFCVPLRKLSRTTVTKNGLLLRAGNYYQFYLRKDSFTKGTYEDFLEFLKEKCPPKPAK